MFLWKTWHWNKAAGTFPFLLAEYTQSSQFTLRPSGKSVILKKIQKGVSPLDASFIAILQNALPKTAHTPHLLLRTRDDSVQLYTNYPLVTGLSPEICADGFNRQTTMGVATVQGDFVHFTLSPEELCSTLTDFAADSPPAAPALPDEEAAYLQYVISTLLETYPPAQSPAAFSFSKEEVQIATLLFYMAQRPENVQKRQHELIVRVTALLRHTIFSKMTPATRLLLQAARVMLQPV